jgi:hypothetical protein
MFASLRGENKNKGRNNKRTPTQVNLHSKKGGLYKIVNFRSQTQACGENFEHTDVQKKVAFFRAS